MRFDGERFGTAVTCLAFSELAESEVVENRVASPTGVTPFTVGVSPWPPAVRGTVTRAA